MKTELPTVEEKMNKPDVVAPAPTPKPVELTEEEKLKAEKK